ncbi:MAG: hypothetical protein BAA04_08925 [Firmicutes bacterium ZCTH02-B6]|nr:MAG: hypothetical protein BAA04_08925 [Firmicutes bacterium ZCTH02-B6]
MKTVGVIAGAGRVPVIGVRAAQAKGWRVFAIALAAGPQAGDPMDGRCNEPACEALRAAGAECETMTVGEYSRIVAAFLERGVREIYVLGKLPKTALYCESLDGAARDVLANRAGQGDHALIEAFVSDLARRGLVVRLQSELFVDQLVPPGFAAGRSLSPREEADMRYGYMVARRLADVADAGQTVVVKDGIVLALEAAEGTDATIRRGGQLGGPGSVVVKVKGRRGIDFELPAVGLETLATVAEAQAGVLAVEAGRTLLLERDDVLKRVAELGIALVAVTGDDAV